MPTTLNIDDRLIKRVAHRAGIQEKTKRLGLGLEALVSREAAKRFDRGANNVAT
jgi:Arc/MetJ family transcription regulator